MIAAKSLLCFQFTVHLSVEVQGLSLTLLLLLGSSPATVTSPHTGSQQPVAMVNSLVVAAVAHTDSSLQVATDNSLATAMDSLQEEEEEVVAEAMANSQVVMASLKEAMEGGTRVKCPCVSVH